MVLDPYAFCPCGSGKKLKFCCRDLAPELEKMERMIEGEQYRACLDHAEKLEKKYPGRVGLMVMMGRLHLYMKEHEEALKLFDAVLEKEPQNTTALAHRSTLKLMLRQVPEAIVDLQLALAAGRDPMPSDVFDSLEMLAKVLTAAQLPMAARAHLQLTLASDPEDSEVGTFLNEIDRSLEVPLLLKDDPNLMPCPEGFKAEDDFEEALWLARVGRWLVAERYFARLAEASPEVPELWFNLALVRGWLANNDGAVEALRKYSVLDGVPLEDALEAEAMAQLLGPVAEEDRLPAIKVSHDISDSQRLLELLLSNKQAWKLPDPGQRDPEEGPPPTAVFRLLDRPQLPNAENLSLDNIPNIIGQVSLFGKQTDREARVEVVGIEGETFDETEALVKQIAGDDLGEASEKEVIHPFAAMKGNFDPRWQLPEGTTREQAHDLVIKHGTDALMNRWPETATHALDGKTAREAAKDDHLKFRVLAQLLTSELATAEHTERFNFNELREKLGLPKMEAIDPTTVDLTALPMCRWHRLEVEKLGDEELAQLMGAALHLRAARAARGLALEVINRPSLDGKVNKSLVYGELSRLETDASQALEYLDRGRELAEAAGQSSAPWDLQELTLRSEIGQPHEVKRILDHITAEHINEPGVRQAVVQFLTSIGVLGPDGQMRPQAMQPDPSEMPGAEEPGSGESGKIWTPESEQGPKEKSALWTPGMD